MNDMGMTTKLPSKYLKMRQRVHAGMKQYVSEYAQTLATVMIWNT